MILGVAALVCALLPAGLIAANWRLFETPAPAAHPTAVSVLLPARDEEENIRPACEAVLANRGVELELIVHDDHSTDRTAEIVRAIADPRLRLVSASPLPGGWSGKQHGCTRLARLARHDLLLFIDADVRLSPDALTRICGFMEREAVGLASGFPQELTESWAETLLLPLIQFLLLGFLPLWLMRRSAAPALGAGCGQLMVARRREYELVGGHGAVPATLHDGIMLPRAFRRAGIMTGLFDASQFARCRMYENARGVFNGLTKNATEGMARPLALPVWTVLLGLGQVLPAVLAVLSPGAVAFCAAGVSFASRLALAGRFRQPIWSALMHPAGVTALLALQWVALVRAVRGRPREWRGRAYFADS